MAQQTAVEWLVNYMLENFHLTDYTVMVVFDQAKQMEKEQNKKTWDAAYKAAKDDIVSDKASTFENYYGKSDY